MQAPYWKPVAMASLKTKPSPFNLINWLSTLCDRVWIVWEESEQTNTSEE